MHLILDYLDLNYLDFLIISTLASLVPFAMNINNYYYHILLSLINFFSFKFCVENPVRTEFANLYLFPAHAHTS